MKSILDFQSFKNKNQKITMVTCYDYTFAKILNTSEIDTLLVGDSVSQVVHGYPTTLHATVHMMELHTAAVAKGAPNKFVVADMPFLSTRKGIKHAVEAAGLLMKAGAQAVKIEGLKGHEKMIQHLIESGIPVMGHLGLTPQSIHQLGGPKIQGRDEAGAENILNDALAMEKAGCFSLVLECIPAELAQKITYALHIPTIGIGASLHTSGQVLVLQDMLGLNADFQPKFLKKYSDGAEATIKAINSYVAEVRAGTFPDKDHSYE
ncbi:MAG: 3-methyl-2-oxobutanoate hydroxymethyltransferase [Bdellovibrionaceae bacterium]|nr:3-methyl-2-oxobutanoate hydroxymethyltransferase [Pseudobdellovibrionaceae bacterium]